MCIIKIKIQMFYTSDTNLCLYVAVLLCAFYLFICMYNAILCLKVNGYTIRGNNFAVFTFASHLSLAEGISQLIK